MEKQLELDFNKKTDEEKEKIVTCKICGCTKTVEELKKEHSKCFKGDE